MVPRTKINDDVKQKIKYTNAQKYFQIADKIPFEVNKYENKQQTKNKRQTTRDKRQ